MKDYPALDVSTSETDLLLAIVDDFAPSAVEERGQSLRIFFGNPDDRDKARAALATRFDVAAVDVSDEDWARRSQENLKPVTVGRITVAPPWAIRNRPSIIDHQSSIIDIDLVILPSMGFGTG